jgi:hypothetical protein
VVPVELPEVVDDAEPLEPAVVVLVLAVELEPVLLLVLRPVLLAVPDVADTADVPEAPLPELLGPVSFAGLQADTQTTQRARREVFIPGA